MWAKTNRIKSTQCTRVHFLFWELAAARFSAKAIFYQARTCEDGLCSMVYALASGCGKDIAPCGRILGFNLKFESRFRDGSLFSIWLQVWIQILNVYSYIYIHV